MYSNDLPHHTSESAVTKFKDIIPQPYLLHVPTRESSYLNSTPTQADYPVSSFTSSLRTALDPVATLKKKATNQNY